MRSPSVMALSVAICLVFALGASPVAAATTYTLWDSTGRGAGLAGPTVRTTRTLSAGKYSLTVWGTSPYAKVLAGTKLIAHVEGNARTTSFSLSRPTLVDFRGVGGQPTVRAQLRGPRQTIGAGLPGPAYTVWQQSKSNVKGTYAAVYTTKTLKPGRYQLSVWGKWAKVYAIVGGKEIAMVDQNGQSVPFALTRSTSVRLMATASPEYVKAVLKGPKQ